MIFALLAGAFFAALISGAAGFGGALLLLPLLTRAVGIEQAVPMLTVAQLVGNFSRVGLGWTAVDWKLAGGFLLTAIPAAAIGAFCFAGAPAQLIIQLLGVAILLFVLARLTGALRFGSGFPLLAIGGGVVGFLSGLVGSAGPLGAAIVLSANLAPAAYVATEAVTAIGMHLTKMVVYQRQLALGPSFWPLALAMGGAMFAGTWTAKRIIDRLPKQVFEKMVSALLILIALHMIWRP
jgi:uncharacterized membrane protein YfcA